MSTKLVTLYGDEIDNPYFTYTPGEAEHAALHGDFPTSFYDRNAHANESPELLGFFLADIIKGVGAIGITKIIDRARDRRRDREAKKATDAANAQTAAMQQQQNAAALQATSIQAKTGVQKIIIPVAIGVAGLVLVAIILKRKG